MSTATNIARLLAEDKAERVSYMEFPAMGIRVLVRRFPKVGGDADEKACLDELNQKGKLDGTDPKVVTNPIATVAYPGEWRVVKNETGKQKTGTDGQGIFQTLAIGTFVVGADGELVQDDCDSSTKRIFYIESATRPTLPPSSIGVVPNMGPVAFNPQFGTWSTYIEITTAKPRLVDLGLTGDAPDEAVYGYDFLNQTYIHDVPVVDGHVYDQDVRVNRDCTKSGRRTGRMGRPETTTDVRASPGALQVTTKRTVQASALAQPTRERGVERTVTNAPSKYHNRFDTTYGEEFAYPQGPAAWRSGDYFSELTEYAGENLYDPLDPGAPPRGFRYSAQNSINRFGYYDGGMGYQREIPRSWSFVSQSSFLGRRGVYRFRNWPDAIVAPDVAGFTQYGAESSITPGGYYDGDLTYEEATTGPLHGNRGMLAFASFNSAERSDKSYTYRRWPDAIVAPPSVPGTTYRADNDLTELGYNSDLVQSDSHPTAWAFQSGSSIIEQEYTYGYGKKRSDIVAPASVPGLVWTALSTLTEDYTYDGRLVGTYSPPLMAGGRSRAIGGRTIHTYDFLAQRSWVEAPEHVRGFAYSAQCSFNRRTGAYDGNLDYEQGRLRTFAFTAREAPDEVTYLWDYENDENAPDTSYGGGPSNVEVTASGQLNDLDLYNWRKSVSIPRDPFGGQTVTWEQRSQYYIVTARNSEGRVTALLTYYRKHDHSAKYVATEAEAITYISGGLESSSHRQVKPGLWRAEKVTDGGEVQV